jgi:hypothetical protein
MVKNATTIEIEVDGPYNENLMFRPLQRAIRGRFDLNRVAEPMARMRSAEWPQPIPSQRLGIEADGSAYVLEPLHDEEHAAIKERIERQGMKLPPKCETFDGVDLVTWLFWIKRAVNSGIARVVAGQLPKVIDGVPKMNFIVDRPAQSAGDRLAAAIERQNVLFEKLLERLSK